jgi:septal ring factor EnvC (AmiA/AmiB activator)
VIKIYTQNYHLDNAEVIYCLLIITVVYLNNYYKGKEVLYLMPRTKGSKNKPKTVTTDFATQIAEKQSAREALAAEIASITANIDSLKADLKEKKASLKVIDKEIFKLEAKKAKADAKVAEEAKKAEAEAVLKKLLAEGMSADEILAKLK